MPVVPALEALLSNPDLQLDGFINPWSHQQGHNEGAIVKARRLSVRRQLACAIR